jgi:hypothetical protein
LSIIKHVTLQKIVSHDFQYDLRNFFWTQHKTADKMMEMNKLILKLIYNLKIHNAEITV